MSKRRVAVTGVGLVTPVGNDVDSSWRQIVAGVSGAAPIEHFDTTGYATRFSASVEGFDTDAYLSRKDARKMDVFVHYGIAAGVQAVRDAGLEGADGLDVRIPQPSLRPSGVAKRSAARRKPEPPPRPKPRAKRRPSASPPPSVDGGPRPKRPPAPPKKPDSRRRSASPKPAAPPEAAAAPPPSRTVDLTGSFRTNRGRLPWPASGTITGRFGTRTDPVSGTRISSPGIDISTAPGAPAVSVFEGVVQRVGRIPTYGQYVMVTHGEFVTLYGNLSQVSVSQGQAIRAGQAIGRSGTASERRGAALFFALYQGGSPSDPTGWLERR